MTLETFMILLFVLALVTSLLTEGIKKFLDRQKEAYSSNVLVFCVSIVVGGLGTAIFYRWNNYAWTSLNIIVIFLMTVANWLVAMLGYDKVKQTIVQVAAVLAGIRGK